MASKLNNYLRTYRKRAGLSQKEVAFLLGCTRSAKVSRYETCARRPNLDAVFACQALFHVPASELFAGEFQKVEEKALARAQQLSEALRKQKLDRRTQRKRETLWAMVSGWGSGQAA